MRVLLIGDVAHTGFGRVTRELASGLLTRGHDVRVIGINHRGLGTEFEELARHRTGALAERVRNAAAEMAADPLLDRLVPAGQAGDGMGTNLTAPAYRGTLWEGWVPEAVIVVADPKAMSDRLRNDDGVIARSGIPTFNYVPIEGTGLPASMREIWEHVTPVAMSRFGQEQLETLLDRPVALAYHGVSEAFRPITPQDPGTYDGRLITSRAEAKAALGYSGTVILRADRYIFRKHYPAFFRIVGPLLDADTMAVVHTPLTDQYGDIRDLLVPGVHLTFAHDSFLGLSDDEMRVLYNAADLYVSPTYAEGFGLCLAESLACGVPVVATDYSAVAEVVGPGGRLIAPTRTFTSPYGNEWALVDEMAMTEAVRGLLTDAPLRTRLGEAGREHVARFRWSDTVDAFEGLMAPALRMVA